MPHNTDTDNDNYINNELTLIKTQSITLTPTVTLPPIEFKDFSMPKSVAEKSAACSSLLTGVGPPPDDTDLRDD